MATSVIRLADHRRGTRKTLSRSLEARIARYSDRILYIIRHDLHDRILYVNQDFYLHPLILRSGRAVTTNCTYVCAAINRLIDQDVLQRRGRFLLLRENLASYKPEDEPLHVVYEETITSAVNRWVSTKHTDGPFDIDDIVPLWRGDLLLSTAIKATAVREFLRFWQRRGYLALDEVTDRYSITQTWKEEA